MVWEQADARTRLNTKTRTTTRARARGFRNPKPWPPEKCAHIPRRRTRVCRTHTRATTKASRRSVSAHDSQRFADNCKRLIRAAEPCGVGAFISRKRKHNTNTHTRVSVTLTRRVNRTHAARYVTVRVRMRLSGKRGREPNHVARTCWARFVAVAVAVVDGRVCVCTRCFAGRIRRVEFGFTRFETRVFGAVDRARRKHIQSDGELRFD